MSTTLDAKIVPKVLTVIETYGTNAVITQPVDPEVVPGVGQLNAGEQSMTRKITPPAQVSGFPASGESAASDMEALIAASGLPFVPVMNLAKLTHNGVTYVITDVLPLYSGDDVAAYTLRLRR